MPLLAIPNVSEGRDPRRIETCGAALTSHGARLMDVHSDADHHRSVLTAAGTHDQLVSGAVALAAAARDIDLMSHAGAHPRLGVLDVCPFVPFEDDMSEAIDAARAAAEGIGELGIPVFLYGQAAEVGVVELPDLRRGGLDGLRLRIESGAGPDRGPHEIDPRTGVVCVGARGPLIAFNVLLDADLTRAREIAATIRRPKELRALAFALPIGAQVSMNLISPTSFGIDAAFAAVEDAAAEREISIVSTEIVGLLEERFLPDPDAKAARLLIEPGRSLESALRD